MQYPAINVRSLLSKPEGGVASILMLNVLVALGVCVHFFSGFVINTLTIISQELKSPNRTLLDTVSKKSVTPGAPKECLCQR